MFKSEIGRRVLSTTKFEKRKIRFLTNYHHGLAYNDDYTIIKPKQAAHIVRLFWYAISDDHPLSVIGVKSKEAEDWLNDAWMPTLNLAAFGATHKNIYSPSSKVCNFHQKLAFNKKPKCSYDICYRLWKWLDHSNTLLTGRQEKDDWDVELRSRLWN